MFIILSPVAKAMFTQAFQTNLDDLSVSQVDIQSQQAGISICDLKEPVSVTKPVLFPSLANEVQYRFSDHCIRLNF